MYFKEKYTLEELKKLSEVEFDTFGQEHLCIPVKSFQCSTKDSEGKHCFGDPIVTLKETEEHGVIHLCSRCYFNYLYKKRIKELKLKKEKQEKYKKENGLF